MVYEIDMTHNVVHVRAIERPTATLEPTPKDVAEPVVEDPAEPWPASFSARLAPLMSEETVEAIKELFLAGPMQPPEDNATEPSKDTADPGTSLPTAFGNARGGKRKGRGKGRDANQGRQVDDKRKVVSNVSQGRFLLSTVSLIKKLLANQL